MGANCNNHEAKLYKNTTQRRRNLLCPVIWCAPNGAVLIMRAAVPLTEEEFDRLCETDQLPDWGRKPGSKEITPFELNKAADFGRLPDGRLVALDYAANPNLNPEWREDDWREDDDWLE